MRLWELEAATGKRFVLQGLSKEIRDETIKERVKRMQILGTYEALSQNLLGHIEEQGNSLRGIIKDLQGEKSETLDLLRQIKQGSIDITRLIVTDDGWRLLPPEPVGESDAPNVWKYGDSYGSNGTYTSAGAH